MMRAGFIIAGRENQGHFAKVHGENRMPRKIRELIRDLEQAGFSNRGGKGDHRNFEHPVGGRVTISGQLGADAKPYQEREVRRAIEESQQ
jgi:predicted RNA binding protein YcfA (HicA-like mRNA interferase family)